MDGAGDAGTGDRGQNFRGIRLSCAKSKPLRFLSFSRFEDEGCFWTTMISDFEKRNTWAEIKYCVDVQENVRYNKSRRCFYMPLLNATTARKNFFKIMEETIVTHEPVIITGKNGNVVMLSEEDWRSIQETLFLCSIPGMREKIIKGIQTPLEECLEDNV
jgi:prevent-host-death family protein